VEIGDSSVISCSFEFVYMYMKNAVFWDVAPCRFCVNRRFGGMYCSLHPRAHAGSSLVDFSTLKMQAICSSETSVHTSSTRRHIPQDSILHSHCCENLKSYIVYIYIFYNFTNCRFHILQHQLGNYIRNLTILTKNVSILNYIFCKSIIYL
jgi:hypothetical protein